MKAPLLAWLTAICAMTPSCGLHTSPSDTVPKPMAYPRLDMPDSVYTTVEASGVRLLVNELTGVSISHRGSRNTWMDVSYGGFASPTVHITVTEYNPGDAKGFIDNRRERMRLNLGGLSYELTELTTPSGWTCEMAVARGIPTTPVQILAYDSQHMISGALMLDIPDSLAYDPIATAPIIDAVTRDMTVMMKGQQ